MENPGPSKAVSGLPISKRFTCDRCGTSFTAKSNLKRHVLNICGKVQVCPHCPFKTARTAGFNSHIRSHVNVGILHKCQFCPYMTGRSADHRRHVLGKHPASKWPICNVCNVIDESKKIWFSFANRIFCPSCLFAKYREMSRLPSFSSLVWTNLNLSIWHDFKLMLSNLLINCTCTIFVVIWYLCHSFVSNVSNVCLN